MRNRLEPHDLERRDRRLNEVFEHLVIGVGYSFTIGVRDSRHRLGYQVQVFGRWPVSSCLS